MCKRWKNGGVLCIFAPWFFHNSIRLRLTKFVRGCRETVPNFLYTRQLRFPSYFLSTDIRHSSTSLLFLDEICLHDLIEINTFEQKFQRYGTLRE